ncbi:A24 family peptidase [Sphingomonas soli]|uniref:A24 family peptidase n=1 Tax=Sphingomonas soli TaxID=266127 RepID=UPI000830245A|nr:prepilin peptidase [Sphingomonas soli]
MGEMFAPFLVITLGILLVAAGVEDARTREIANWKNAVIALLALPWWWANGLAVWPDMALQIGVAAIVFAFFAGAFALGQMGGGDVKLIGALALWFPLQPLIWMLILMSLIGGVLTLLMVAEKKLRSRSGMPLEIPYGVAIALATLIVLREPIFNQFQ